MKYKTKNLSIASYLYASDMKFEIERDGKQCYFLFAKNEAIELVEKYYADLATVNPKKLFGCLSDLKDLIFAEQ